MEEGGEMYLKSDGEGTIEDLKHVKVRLNS